MTVRIECCKTQAIADTRRGNLETIGFTVRIVNASRAVQARANRPDGIVDDEAFLFGAEQCPFLLVAVK